MIRNSSHILKSGGCIITSGLTRFWELAREEEWSLLGPFGSRTFVIHYFSRPIPPCLHEFWPSAVEAGWLSFIYVLHWWLRAMLQTEWTQSRKPHWFWGRSLLRWPKVAGTIGTFDFYYSHSVRQRHRKHSHDGTAVDVFEAMNSLMTDSPLHPWCGSPCRSSHDLRFFVLTSWSPSS
jgi:hypothetical protein